MPTQANPAPDRRLIARSLGLLFLAFASLAELWALTVGDGAVLLVPLLITCGIGQAVGLALRRGFFDESAPVFHELAIALGTALASAAYLFSGSADSGFAYFILWAAPYAVFFGLRSIAIQTAFAALCLLGVHIAHKGGLALDDTAAWLLPVCTLAVVCAIGHQLGRELTRADRERWESERERASAEARRASSERERARREAAMGWLGRMALRAADRGGLLQETVRVLGDTLRAEHCTIFELVGEQKDRMRLAAGSGFATDLVAEGDFPVDQRELAGWLLAGDEPVIVWEWASERRFVAPLLKSRGVRSTAAAAIRGRSGAFGILAVHSTQVGTFNGEDAKWLQSVADLLASALDRERSESVMRYQSLHDALTGLPNRTLLYDRIEYAFARSERYGTSVAVLLLDVDQFKTVNDSLGHQAGDELLIEVGQRLRTVVRGSDTVARLGGDEFVVLCDVESHAEAFEIAERISEAFAAPFTVGSGEVFASASVGIAVAREAEQPDKMLREADAAMYRAKDRGRGRAEMFDEEMRRDAFARLRNESDLRRALERDQFVLMYQPIFGVKENVPIGVEALLRWEHPQRGLVGPADFIPLAEETGLIVPLGRWALERATAEVASWTRSMPGVPPLRVTVNVSGRQLAKPEFLDEVRAALDASGLPPDSLGLEITESVLMKDLNSPRSTLEAIRAQGVRVYLDDFGTGYSSLARLQSFPLDAIKIDRSFVDGLGREDEDSAIVTAIIEIARSMHLHVVAEGVESEEQLARLHELGCDSAQGYLFAMPLRGSEVEDLLGMRAAA